MTTTDLGVCEWFVWDLRRSNLIESVELDRVVGEFFAKNPGAEPPQLADFLVTQKLLTAFQAERILQGKTQGFVLGPFKLMDAIGSGTMGTVYKALSKNDDKNYAVKVLPRRSMWNVRIARRKVRLFEQCSHPVVVPFVDVGTAGGMHYLAWPMVDGKPLDKIVMESGKLAPDQAARYALQAAEGLEASHQLGLFHGLLKPSNLMIISPDQLRILDFGIGCLLAETEGESLVDTMSTANAVSSGLDCSSPESIMDPTNLNAIGDQYSLGCVLYYCLTGRYPFPDGSAVEKMMAHQNKQPKPIKEFAADAPDGLIAVVERLMQKNPVHRYVSCMEVVEALRPFTTPGGAPVVLRRATMQMPRIRVLRQTSPMDQTPVPNMSESPISRSAIGQPLPPVAPSSLPQSSAPLPAAPRSDSASTVSQREPVPTPVAPQPVVEWTRLRPTPTPTDPMPVPSVSPATQPARLEEPQRGSGSGNAIIIIIAILAGILSFLVSRAIF